jgi:3',5'-cyclic AMP phosphodiesterase CpdA
MFRLAHLSDPHVPPDGPPRRRDLLSQRAIGWVNWQRNRRRVHVRHVLDAVTGDIHTHAPDHIAVTGDLAIVSTPAEWRACRAWLDHIGPPDKVSLVPGNHDTYVRRAVTGTELAWREYMAGDPDTLAHGGFPYLRRRGPLALVGCSSAIVTAPFLATGKVGRDQLARLEMLLARLGREGWFRVVMIHHPPTREPGDRFRRLLDAREVAAALERAGAELILHGHEHRATLRWLPGPVAPIPVVGVPSASALEHGGRPAAQYNLFDISGMAGAWSCRMIVRGFDGGVLHTLCEQELRTGRDEVAPCAAASRAG